MNRCLLWPVLFASLAASMPTWADPWETGPNGSDNSIASSNVLWPSAPPQHHDLANVGGVVDQDWMRMTIETNRSYEVMILNSNIDWLGGQTIQRFAADGTTLLETGASIDRGAKRRALRWIHTAAPDNQFVKVTGDAFDTATAFYEIVFRETTMYCPRFNNAGSQVSVLIVQRAASELAQTCTGTAFFYNEDQAVVGTQALSIGGNVDVSVYSLPGIAGLAGQKGGATIAHTCGLGGVKAKLVALEPATGFSFDTPCSQRDY
jgi:hypothetical protein